MWFLITVWQVTQSLRWASTSSWDMLAQGNWSDNAEGLENDCERDENGDDANNSWERLSHWDELDAIEHYAEHNEFDK